MVKKSDKSCGICYRPFPHIGWDLLHPFIDPDSIPNSTQAIWTIQCALNLVSFAVLYLASAGDGHNLKLTTVNQKIVARWLNAKIIIGGKKKPSSVQNKINDAVITVFSDAGLLDNDETNGEEQLVAINSPPKGKK
jgi:hypothetical protein